MDLGNYVFYDSNCSLEYIVLSDKNIYLNKFVRGCFNDGTKFVIYLTFEYSDDFSNSNLDMSNEGWHTVYFYSENEPSPDGHNYWHYVNGVPTPWEI